MLINERLYIEAAVAWSRCCSCQALNMQLLYLRVDLAEIALNLMLTGLTYLLSCLLTLRLLATIIGKITRHAKSLQYACIQSGPTQCI